MRVRRGDGALGGAHRPRDRRRGLTSPSATSTHAASTRSSAAAAVSGDARSRTARSPRASAAEASPWRPSSTRRRAMASVSSAMRGAPMRVFGRAPRGGHEVKEPPLGAVRERRRERGLRPRDPRRLRERCARRGGLHAAVDEDARIAARDELLDLAGHLRDGAVERAGQGVRGRCVRPRDADPLEERRSSRGEERPRRARLRFSAPSVGPRSLVSEVEAAQSARRGGRRPIARGRRGSTLRPPRRRATRGPNVAFQSARAASLGMCSRRSGPAKKLRRSSTAKGAEEHRARSGAASSRAHTTAPSRAHPAMSPALHRSTRSKSFERGARSPRGESLRGLHREALRALAPTRRRPM